MEGGRLSVVHGNHADYRWYIAELATEGGKLVHRVPGRDALDVRGPTLKWRLVVPEDEEAVGLCLFEDPSCVLF